MKNPWVIGRSENTESYNAVGCCTMKRAHYRQAKRSYKEAQKWKNEMEGGWGVICWLYDVKVLTSYYVIVIIQSLYVKMVSALMSFQSFLHFILFGLILLSRINLLTINMGALLYFIWIYRVRLREVAGSHVSRVSRSSFFYL